MATNTTATRAAKATFKDGVLERVVPKIEQPASPAMKIE